MGVERTDYLMWGAKVDPEAVDVDRDEAEMHGDPGAAFDLVYDGMSGEYAIAGKIVAKAGGYDAECFQEIALSALGADPAVVSAVTERFPGEHNWRLYFFTHFH